MKKTVKNFRSVILLIVIVFVAREAISQINIDYGETITGNITINGEVHVYNFEGNAYDKVLIRLPEFCEYPDYYIEPFLQLFDPGGGVLDTVWDESQSQIFFTLPISGIYTIFVSDKNGDNTGEYSIFVQRTFEADKPLDQKTIVSNRPLYFFGLNGFTKSRTGQNLFLLFRHNNSSEYFTNINVRYPFNLSLESMMMLCSGKTLDGRFLYISYINPNEAIPDNITIPGKSITAECNSSNDEITNIQISGESDQIGASWFYDTEGQCFISWYIYAENDIPTLTRPELPQEIMNDIGDKISLLKYDYTYYNKTNPFKQFNFPVPLVGGVCAKTFSSNNFTKEVWYSAINEESQTTTATYQYNSNNYPTSWNAGCRMEY